MDSVISVTLTPRPANASISATAPGDGDLQWLEKLVGLRGTFIGTPQVLIHRLCVGEHVDDPRLFAIGVRERKEHAGPRFVCLDRLRALREERGEFLEPARLHALMTYEHDRSTHATTSSPPDPDT